MENIDLGRYQPSCILAHSLINKLSAIIGNCDLLKEEAPEDPKCLQRLGFIRETARAMAEELRVHQCHLGLINQNHSSENQAEGAMLNTR
jgi:hypothetical protein